MPSDPHAPASAGIDRELQQLQNKLSALYGRVQAIYDTSCKLNDEPIAIENFLADCFTLDTLRNDFLTTINERNRFQVSSPENPVPNYSSAISFEQLYSRIKYKVHKLSQVTDNTSRDQGSAVKCEKKLSIKLPALELCSFDGEIESWPMFYETFKTVIHENPDLTESEKTQYLVGKLKGKALSICQGILPTAENYSVIWNTLVSKYNDKRVRAATYLDKLFALNNVKENSPTNLEEFIDQFSSIYSALKQMNIDNLEDFLFIHIACKKVGLETVKSYELHISNDKNKTPNCQEFISFVRNQSHILQRALNISSSTNRPASTGGTQLRKNTSSHSSGNYGSRSNNNNVKTFINVQEQDQCVSCGKSEHFRLSQCPKFLSKTPSERYKFVKMRKMCVNCLSDKHNITKCAESTRCSECQRSHHSLLHFPTSNTHSNTRGSIPIASSTTAIVTECTEGSSREKCAAPECGPVAVSLCAVGECAAVAASSGPWHGDATTTSVLLGTAQCHIVDTDGNICVLRAIIDSASQRDLITTECCKRLKLKMRAPQNKYVSGVGDVTNPIEGVTCLTIRSKFDDSVRFNIQPVVVNRITNELPTAKIDASRLDYLNNIPLADCNYFTPANIDLILGADVFARIVGPNTISRAAGEPVAIETLLGYIIVGEAPIISPASNIVRTYCTTDLTFENCVNRFFELEEVPNVPTILSPDEQKCEDYYCETTRRDCNGRYVVSLPLKNDTSELGDSLRSAEYRYLSLERKLLLNPSVKEEYDKVFVDYLQKNYLRPVGTISEVDSGNDQYVIPHHAVVRTDKSTTKLRVVLNASNVTTSGKSLNDILYIGPNLQNDLFQILLKFRLRSVAISADIRQMYLRILMDEKYTRFQRLLYRFDINEPINIFEMTRVPFGLCCSPYLAIRTVRQLALDERERCPLAADVAETDIYMDDLATSCSSVAEGIALSNQLIDLFAAGGFELVKFSSNSPEVLSNIPVSHRISETVEFSSDSQLKILGLHWVPAEDVFTFSVTPQSRDCTKRNILSTIARLWDLMGFVAPVTLLAKLIIKSLWRENIGWDEVPPANVVALWQKFEAELPLLQQIKLPRHLGVNDGCVISILGFADASENAYGGVVYLHVSFPMAGKPLINLVCAKSKVAPSKTVISLARMELCANLILARLMRLVIDTYSTRCQISNIYAFTDSTVALAWIHSLPNRWQTFVANRIAKIQSKLEPRHFHHIPGKENPADCLSRGLTPAQLLDHPLWLHGPRFAHLPFPEWPVHRFDPASVSEMPEMKVNVMATTVPAAPQSASVFYDLSSRVSSWSKLLRIVVYILRFIKKLPRKFEVSHLEQAEEAVIRELQQIHFPNELKLAQSGGNLPPAFLKLKTFVKGDLLRVGGRLSNADLSYDSQHPILLPRKDHIVDLLIDYYHQKYLHTGPQLLMSLLRQKYWILSARNIVRNPQKY